MLRLAWVFPARYLIVRPRPEARGGAAPPWTYTFILGWAGMRGVVTLAAAFVIPEETEYREVLLLMAFTVVAGTLFLQGTDAARASPGGSGCPGPTRPRTRWPARPCSSRPRRRRCTSSRTSSTTTRTVSST